MNDMGLLGIIVGLAIIVYLFAYKAMEYRAQAESWRVKKQAAEQKRRFNRRRNKRGRQ